MSTELFGCLSSLKTRAERMGRGFYLSTGRLWLFMALGMRTERRRVRR